LCAQCRPCHAFLDPNVLIICYANDEAITHEARGPQVQDVTGMQRIETSIS
jgi:hypothetical protein